MNLTSKIEIAFITLAEVKPASAVSFLPADTRKALGC